MVSITLPLLYTAITIISSINLLQNNFDILINSFIDNKVVINDTFLSKLLSIQLKDNLTALYANKELKVAGTGNNVIVEKNKLFRSDMIYWLDRSHDNLIENSFLDIIDAFIIHLNESCYTGITGYEFHYALYEKGSFYKRHLDQFKNNDSRKYTMIMYLNDEWVENDGGELCIFHTDHEQQISPMGGKMIFFKSNELEHEVQVTNKPRMSITGWLKTEEIM